MCTDEQGRPLLVRPPRLEPDALLGLTREQQQLVLAGLAEAAEEAQKSISDGTRRVYWHHCGAFVRWCDRPGWRAYPTHPAALAVHIAQVAYREAPDGSQVPGTLRHAALQLRVYALDAWNDAGEHPRPGDSPLVQAQLAAARDSGPPPRSRNDPLLADDAKALLLAPDPRDAAWLRARDTMLAILAADRRLSGARIARLAATDLAARPEGLLVGGGKPVLLPPRADAACPLAAHAQLAGALPDASGPAVARDDGQQYGPQGLVKKARAVARALGLPLPASGPARCPGAVLAAALAAAAEAVQPDAEHPSAVRDRSMGIAQYLRGLRSGSVGIVPWRMARPAPGYGPRGPVEVHVPRSKTDQHGDGTPIVLEETGRVTSPAALFWAWVDCAALLVGGDPWEVMPDGPLWFPLLANGSPAWQEDGTLACLSAQAVSEAIAKRAVNAGIGGRICGGSMRSGLVTSLCETRARPQDVAAISDHVTLASLARYDRSKPGRIGTADTLGF